ncbi:MAG: class I SAM-dependent methyltransferase [Acidimicrobiales bacterium]
MSDDHEHHDHDHHHGHHNDQGIAGALRYLRWAPSMWRSDINSAVIDLVDPKPGERVVDVGAGMGAGTVVASSAGASVVAVEPTPFLRAVLQIRRGLRRDRKRIEVIDATAEDLRLDDRSIDAIWAVNTMHHWTDPERGVAEIARVLRPGGRVVLVDEDFTDPTHPEFDKWGPGEGDGEHHGFTMVEARRMGELLTAAGLEEVDASNRKIAGRPVIAIDAKAPTG